MPVPMSRLCAAAALIAGVAVSSGAGAMPMAAGPAALSSSATSASPLIEVRHYTRAAAARKEHRINHRYRCNKMPSRC